MPLLVHAVEAIEARLIKVDEERRALGSRHRASAVIALTARIIRLFGVRLLEAAESPNHRLHIVANGAIGRDQVLIDVREERGARLAMEEEGTAADEGLDVSPALEARGEERFELSKKPAFSTDPFDEGCGGSSMRKVGGMGGERGSTLAHGRDLIRADRFPQKIGASLRNPPSVPHRATVCFTRFGFVLARSRLDETCEKRKT